MGLERMNITELKQFAKLREIRPRVNAITSGRAATWTYEIAALDEFGDIPVDSTLRSS
jgi:hypothetical protein